MALEPNQMYRLVPRGGPGITCDAKGGALGGIPVTWCCKSDGFARWRTRSPSEIGEILERAYGVQPGNVVERCHRGFLRVAACLAADDLALAGFEALMLRLPRIDDVGMSKLSGLGDLAKGDDNVDEEPRVPLGQPGGGEWTTGGANAPQSPPPRPPSSGAPHGAGHQTAGDSPKAPSPRQNTDGFQPDGEGGYVFLIPSISAGQDIRPTEVHSLDPTAFQVGWNAAGLIQLKDAKGNTYSVEGNLPAIEQFNATTGRTLGVNIRAYPAVQPSSPDPVTSLVDLSNSAAGDLVETANWLQHTAVNVPIALEIAAGEPEFPMGAAAVATTDPTALQEVRPVSNLEVIADALSIVGALAPVARIPAASAEAVQAAGRSQVVAAELARNTPGVVTVSRDLTAASGDWLRAGVPTPIPLQVADGLVGQRFNNFASLRGSVWKAVADEPELSATFSPQNLGNIKAGNAPFVPSEFQTNASDAGSRFHLHHVMPIEEDGPVYDLGNIQIVDPATHYQIHYQTLKRLLEDEMVERLNRNQLISIIHIVGNPKGFSSEEVTQKLFLFCVNCPDPVGAMRLVVEDRTPRTDEQLVDFALAMPIRNVADIPASELPLYNPLRHIHLDR